MAIILKGYNRFSDTARWPSYAHDPMRSSDELVQPRRFQLFYQADSHGFSNSKGGGQGTTTATKNLRTSFDNRTSAQKPPRDHPRRKENTVNK